MIFLLFSAYKIKKVNMFKHFNELSPALNKGIQLFTERLDMTQRDRELFYDIIGFAFDEGKIAGKEHFLEDQKKSFKQTDKDGE